MALHYSTWLNMAIVHSAWPYSTLQWVYMYLTPYQFIITLLLSMHHSTMVLLHPTSIWFFLPLLYFRLLDSTLFYQGLTLHHSEIALLHSMWIYVLLPWFSLTLLEPTLPYHDSTSLYLTLHHPTMHGSTSLYFNLHDSPMALIPSTSHYSLIDLLVFTVCFLHSISLYTSLYWGSISLNLTLLFLQLLYFPLLDSALFYFAST